MVKKNDKLFYALLKSYVLFAAILIFLALILDINNQAVEVNLLQLLLFLVLFGICSLFYALWIAIRITGPLEKISSAIQRRRKIEDSRKANGGCWQIFPMI